MISELAGSMLGQAHLYSISGKAVEIPGASGGGMTMDRIPDMREVYGNEVIYLVGGGLHPAGDDLVENSRILSRLVTHSLEA